MKPSTSAPSEELPFDPYAIQRPAPILLRYYALASVLAGPFFPVAFIPLLFKYETLKYRFDEHGIAMTWGLLFRREIYLTYRRIQDIHLTRNIIQRWMGLATVAVQTASGSATPEMCIDGVLEAGSLRDFLYSRMRGARDEHTPTSVQSPAPPVSTESEDSLSLLREIRDLVQNLAQERRRHHD
jgi:uncharacterized protein